MGRGSQQEAEDEKQALKDRGSIDAATEKSPPDTKGKPPEGGEVPRPEIETVVDYTHTERDRDIGNPHRSAVIVPALTVVLEQRDIEDVSGEEEDDELEYDYNDEGERLPRKEIKRPTVGAFGSVDPLQQKLWERQCLKRARVQLDLSKWPAAIEICRDGLEIDPNSRPLDRYVTQAYERWGEQEMGAGNYGSAAVVYRQGIEDDVRDSRELKVSNRPPTTQLTASCHTRCAPSPARTDSVAAGWVRVDVFQAGLERASKRELELRVAVYQDKPFAASFCFVIAVG
jgi:hypothetical protein